MLLCTLFLAALTAGIYVFVNPIQNTSDTYTVDKYSDVVSWCDTNTKDNQLSIDCKALLLDIRNTEDGSSCFDVQVITKDKELKDFSVCEKGDTLAYTNDVLGYKKLMPIDMVFEYTKENILSSYSFSRVSFDKVDDTYIQGIVSEDIANLVTIDPSTTTIQNSVDFCPRPEMLPSYITEESKAKYTVYLGANTLVKTDYNYSYLYNRDDSILRILFACESAQDMEYPNICNMNQTQGFELLPSGNISHINATIDWGRKLTENDTALLKEISLIYDSIFLQEQQNNYINLQVFDDLIIKINKTESINASVFCGIYKVYSSIEKFKNGYSSDKTIITDLVTQNRNNVTSSLCSEILSPADVDQEGLYTKIYIVQSGDLFERCNNLTKFLKH